MHIEYMRDKSNVMPEIENPELIISMKIWHCNYKSFHFLKQCINIEELIIATCPEESFGFLTNCLNLKYLSVDHLPRITKLDHLIVLQKLECLSLATLPSWAGSGKVSTIESLKPLTKLKSLRYLELYGVRPPDKSPYILQDCSSLISAEFNKYSKKAVNDFFASTKIMRECVPEPKYAV